MKLIRILKDLTAFLLIIAFVSMNLKCGGECNRLFSAPRSLTRHRQTCKHWQRQLTLQSQHFKRISASLQDSQAPPAKKMKFSAQVVSAFTAHRTLNSTHLNVSQLLPRNLHLCL